MCEIMWILGNLGGYRIFASRKDVRKSDAGSGRRIGAGEAGGAFFLRQARTGREPAENRQEGAQSHLPMPGVAVERGRLSEAAVPYAKRLQKTVADAVRGSADGAGATRALFNRPTGRCTTAAVPAITG